MRNIKQNANGKNNLENCQNPIQIAYQTDLAHFARTAPIRKRGGEKRTQKHNEKTPKIHEKRDEKSLPFPDAVRDRFFTHFWVLFDPFCTQNRPKSGNLPSRAQSEKTPIF